MALDKAAITEAIRDVPAPAGGGDLVAAGVVKHIAACDGHVSLKLQVQGEAALLEMVALRARRAVQSHAARGGDALLGFVVEFVDEAGKTVRRVEPGVGAGPAQQTSPSDEPHREPRAVLGGTGGTATDTGHRPISGLAPTPQGQVAATPWVKHVIAVGAGKGGVGKSSIAVNLAVGLSRRGHAVGLLDGDIYGPSLPTMLGLHDYEQAVIRGRLQPFLVHGVKAITLGKLVEADKPLIWRGPMAHGAFKQLVEQSDWGELDYLVIDLPPGTGDVSLTMAQSLKLTGAVVVCTPQRVAQDDAVRAAKMFQQLGIEVLGVVENMSYFVGDDGKEYDIFGKGGAEKMAARLGLPFLGAVPITTALRENSDRGDPSANFRRGSLANALETVVENVEKQAALASIRQGKTRPTLKIR
jgi:ATP-binding protein involved in chromosome partitioning